MYDKIAVIGYGNVGNALVDSLLQNGITVDQILTTKKQEIKVVDALPSIQFITDYSDLKADLCLVCVSDDAVNSVINRIPPEIPVAHTSGSIQLESLDRKKNVGVFYPLQTISKERKVNFKEIPLLVEASDENLKQKLIVLAKSISEEVHEVSSEKRKEIHLAAVFINNFVNHQIFLAEQLAERFQFDKLLLKPLLLETVYKAIDEGAYNAQTGPGRRGDVNVIATHEAMLPNDLRLIYHTLTESIIKTYHG